MNRSVDEAGTAEEGLLRRQTEAKGRKAVHELETWCDVLTESNLENIVHVGFEVELQTKQFQRSVEMAAIRYTFTLSTGDMFTV